MWSSYTRLVLRMIALLATGGFLSSCGKGPAIFCALPSTVIGSSCRTIQPNSGAEFLYTSSGSQGGQILSFPISRQSGALRSPTAISGPASATGMASARNTLLYVADSERSAIDGFLVDPTTGILTPIPGSPFAPPGPQFFAPLALAADTNLYATGPTGATGFTIASSGVLSTIVGSPYSGGFNGQVVLGQSNTNPANHFLFATNTDDPNGAISVFRIVDLKSGILTPVPGNFVTGSASRPEGIVFSNAFSPPLLFVALNKTNRIAVFSVDASTGELTPVPSPPVVAGSGPKFLAMDPNQQFLYALNVLDGTISGFKIAENGTLFAVNGSPFAVGSDPAAFVITEDDFLYVTLPEQNIIKGYSIDATDGRLSLLASSPFAAVDARLMSVVSVPVP